MSRYENSVVTVETNGSIGTGFYVTEEFIVTNLHVIKSMSDIHFYNRYESGPVNFEYIVDIDVNNDLAILYTEKKGNPVPLAESSMLPKGSEIAVIGSPKGHEKTISSGLYSGLRGSGDLQISAPISSGSSGSPVFNESGDVVGVVVAQRLNAQNLNFAIPSERLITLLSKAQSIPKDKYHKIGQTSIKDIIGVDASTTSTTDGDYASINYDLPGCKQFESNYFESPRHGPVKKCVCNGMVVFTNIFCQCHPCRP
ncbi:S1 family peptidase [Solidesulfovibrio sp.]